MKRGVLLFLLVVVFVALMPLLSEAQCSICTKTAQQLGEEPAKGLNSGILYLMAAPLGIAGYIGFRWWQREKQVLKDEV